MSIKRSKSELESYKVAIAEWCKEFGKKVKAKKKGQSTKFIRKVW